MHMSVGLLVFVTERACLCVAHVCASVANGRCMEGFAYW